MSRHLEPGATFPDVELPDEDGTCTGSPTSRATTASS